MVLFACEFSMLHGPSSQRRARSPTSPKTSMTMDFLSTTTIRVCSVSSLSTCNVRDRTARLLLSWALGSLHSVVVYPESTEDVVKIVKIATRFRMPVIPYAGGTCLEGQTRGVSTPYNSFVSAWCSYGASSINTVAFVSTCPGWIEY